MNNDTQNQAIRNAVDSAVKFIKENQQEDGALPWFENGKVDPWDHSEALMALSVAGESKAACKAFDWLSNHQNTDGSWYAQYQGTTHMDQWKKDTNFCAYPAAALWHYYLCTREHDTVARFYPMIKRAINYVCDQQSEFGDINWAKSEKETLAQDSLVTACCGILISLESAASLAEVMAEYEQAKTWQEHADKLRHCLTTRPERFDRTWDPKTRFSMDWFYPIMAGVFDKQTALHRLASGERFVSNEIGCRCVDDEPWVTIAESCEYSIALLCLEKKQEAANVLQKLLRFQEEDGGFWTGYNYETETIWPKEKTLWTAGAFVLACDKLLEISNGCNFFLSDFY